MSQAAALNTSHLPQVGRSGRLVTGRVVERDGGAWVIDLGEGRLLAQRAAGCLLEPAEGDLVVVAQLAGDSRDDTEVWILNVLEREDRGPSRVSIEGDLEVVAPQGSVRVQAKEGIALGTPGATRITSGTFELVAISAKVLTRRLHALGERARSEITKVEVVAETVDSLTERWRLQAKRAFRMIEGLDQLRAGSIDARAKGFARSHAADQVVTADGLVKVDGKQIHMG